MDQYLLIYLFIYKQILQCFLFNLCFYILFFGGFYMSALLSFLFGEFFFVLFFLLPPTLIFDHTLHIQIFYWTMKMKVLL